MKTLINIVKSFHFWSWLILILVTVFSYFHPRQFDIYDNVIDKSLANLEWFMLWIIFAGFWFFVYSMFVMIFDD